MRKLFLTKYLFGTINLLVILFYGLCPIIAQTTPLSQLSVDSSLVQRCIKTSRNFYQQGNYQKAKASLDTLLTIAPKIYSPNSSESGTILLLAGNINFKQSAYDTAIAYYEKARAIYVQDSTKFLKPLGKCLGDLGAVCLQKGDFDRANALFVDAAAIKKATVGENSISLAYTYYNIGAGFAQQGDYQAALDYFVKSVGIIRKIKGEQHPDVAYVYNGIGKVYMREGKWTKANTYFQDALAIRKFTKTDQQPAAANDYDVIGIVHQENGDLDLAKKSYEQAFEIRTNTLQPNHADFRKSYLNLAAINLLNEDLATAKMYALKNLKLITQTLKSDHSSLADTYFQLARIARKQDDLDQALDYYQTALVNLVPAFESLNLTDNPEVTSYFRNKTKLSDLLYRKGTTLFHKYKAHPEKIDLLTSAYETLTVSHEVSELIRNGYDFDYSKKAWLSESFVIYGALIEVGTLLAQQPNAKVDQVALFNLMEKSKSILLLETINDATAKEYAGVPSTILNQEKNFKKQIVYFENQLIRQKERGTPPTDKKLMALEDKVFQFRQQYQTLVSTIETDYPQYYQLKYDHKLASITDIQQALSDDTTLLLQYALTAKNLHIMAIGKTSVAQHQQAIDSTFFNELSSVKQFLSTNPDLLTKKQQVTDRQQFIKNAFSLQKQLLAPILAKIVDPKTLIIIPDGALNALPFEALLVEQPITQNPAFDQLNYAVQNYTINYEYSATLWWQNTLKENNSKHLFAGFAPTYQGTELIAARAPKSAAAYKLLGQKPTFTSLKYNQSEVNELAQAINGETIIGKAATAKAFKTTAKDYGILHLAMHAYVDDENPNYSHLVFAEEKDSLEDRFLYAYELYNMDLKADLAVLSACETGSGQLQKGEGVMSLSRAFKYAGVPNIVMSFWKADDFYTKNIMTHFYQFLKNGVGKNSALQQAKIAQINSAKDNKAAAHPYYWANFVLVGDEQPVQFQKMQWWGWATSVLLLAIIGLIGFRKNM